MCFVTKVLGKYYLSLKTSHIICSWNKLEIPSYIALSKVKHSDSLTITHDEALKPSSSRIIRGLYSDDSWRTLRIGFITIIIIYIFQNNCVSPIFNAWLREATL